MTKGMIPETSFQSLLETLKDDPMRAASHCRDAFQTSAKAHHEVVHEMIAFIVAFVLHLEGSPQARADFIVDVHWDGKPQPPKEKNLTRLVAMWMVGAKQSYGALYQQALEYTKVAKYFLEIEIEPELIPEKLRCRPIYKLLDKLDPPQGVGEEARETSAGDARAQPKATPTGAAARSGGKQNKRGSMGDEDDVGERNEEDDGNDHHRGDEGGRSNDGDDGEDDDNNIGASRKADNRTDGSDSVSDRKRNGETSTDSSSTKKMRPYPFNQKRELAADAEPYFKDFFELDDYEELPVMIRRLPEVDGWPKFEVSDLLERRDYRTAR